MQGKAITCLISPRPGTLRKLTALSGEVADLYQAICHQIASRRAKVEHVFRDLKIRFGYSMVRYRGITKNKARFILLAVLSNLFRARNYERRQGMIAS